MCRPRDTSRDFQIHAMRTGGATYEEIGTALGFSRERARQLCVRLGLVGGRAGIDPSHAFRTLAQDASITSFPLWASRLSAGIPTIYRLCTELGRMDEVKNLFATRRRVRRGKTSLRLLTDVASLALALGRSPRLREFRAHYGRCATFQKQFGTWNTCLRAAGLDPVSPGAPGHLQSTMELT